ncbi:MAG: squalene/phytoene synthase family protein [Paracoccaceae bacterium]
MSLDACAQIVERNDPDRFLAVMAAPLWTRGLLLPLYAFNLEVARAPWVAQEPLVAEMRLQWWRDVVEAAGDGAAPPAHEVAGPLHHLIRDAGLPVGVLDRLIAARRWDCWREPFDDRAALESYLDDSAGGLMWLAVRALGAPDAAEGAARAYGRAAGMAAFLRAMAELRARGRHPLPAGADVAGLARRGLDWLAEARAARRRLPGAVRPALLAGWQAGALLRKAEAVPDLVEGGQLALSEFARRRLLLWQAVSGRF